MSPELVTLLLFGSLVVGLLMGIPLSFLLGGVAMVFTYFLWGHDALYMVAPNIVFAQMGMVLVCLPLFVFMGCVLEEAGIADDLFAMIYQWIGSLKGGLAMGTVLVCTIFAAMSGVSAVAVLTMGLIALPAMLKRNYSKNISLGAILAGGALGILIPPSVPMILYAFVVQVSIGQLFVGGIFPGLILSCLFCIYIGIRCRLQPSLGPPVPVEERVSIWQKFVAIRGLILPALLIMAVLGSIFTGVASPTESAAVGASGSLLCAVVKRRLSWKLISEATLTTLRVTAMAMWIVIAAKCFVAVYAAVGGQKFARNLVSSLGVSRWVILIGMQLSLFFLGMILDITGIILLTAPIFAPIAMQLGFNPIWFGVLFTVNMEMALITPPFGWNLFYMKGIVPKGITMGDIYRSVFPFVLLQMIGLALVIAFPQLALWLPSLMIK